MKSVKRLCTLWCTLMLLLSTLPPVSALSYSGSSSYQSGSYYTALTAVNLTGDPRTDIVRIAQSQVGYQEGSSSSELSGTVLGSSNYTEYGRWYGMQDMWCAIFTSWCADVAGISTDIVPKHAYTPSGLTWFINKGQAYSRETVAAGGYTPQPGDIIYFKGSRNEAICNHVGIVTSYSNGTIYTVEGNTSSTSFSTNGGCVATHAYSVSNTYIVYICSPAYTSTAATAAKSAVFNATYYSNSYADLKAAFGTDEALLYKHYLEYGINEGRQASPIFKVDYYRTNNADIQSMHDNNKGAYDHYIEYGVSEVRITAPSTNLGDDFYAKIVNVAGTNVSISSSTGNVYTYQDSTSDAQVWHFVRQGNNSYCIINKKTGLYLSVTDSTGTSGGDLHTNAADGSTGQQWFLHDNGEGAYVLRPWCSGSCVLDVTGGGNANNIELQTYGYNGSADQHFTINVTHTHTWTAATCTSPKTCATCGTTEGSAAGHSWTAATCTSPKTCATCGTTEGSAAGHSWTAATCTSPKTCATCGTTAGSAAGHSWTAATCTSPKICATCGTTAGSAAGHSYVNGICTVCGQADPNESLTLVYTVADENSTVKVYIRSDGTYKLTVSGDGAMLDWKSTAAATYLSTITSIEVEEGITTLPYAAFQNMTALVGITLPSSVTTLPPLCFSGCQELNAIDLTHITRINNKAFMGAGLTAVKLADNTTLGDAVFYGCKRLASADLGNVIAYNVGNPKYWVPAQTFVNCAALKTVMMGSKVNTIGTAAFKSTGLESITIPGTVKTVSSKAFVSNKSLKTLIVEEGVRTIGYNAFAACTALEAVTLPNSVTGVSTGAFYSCRNVRKVTVGSGLAKTGTDLFLDNRALTEVVLPDTMTELGIRTFSKCGTLTAVTLPENLDTIQKLAFFACYSLPEITIPANVTTIGDNAFDGCKAMTTVTIDSATVAAGLVSAKSMGYVARYADTVYIRSDIPTVGRYITATYTRADTVTMDGVAYVIYKK